jgi:D-hydroxyproline dehydrogenase subunit gamma
LSATRGLVVRVLPREAAVARIVIDGSPVEAWQGESVLVAVLAHGTSLRQLEFGGEPRAGFCLMGACQDCWVWIGDGDRARACTTRVADGMRIFTRPPE